MISKEKVRDLVNPGLEGTKIVLVDISVGAGNQIRVLLDSFEGVTIDKCVEISRLVEHNLDREIEDFELEVSSYGLGQPFKLSLHYLKNINRQVEVYCKDGRNLKGTLKTVELTEDKKEVSFIEILNKKKVKQEGKKKKIEVEEITKLTNDEIQKTKLVPVF